MENTCENATPVHDQNSMTDQNGVADQSNTAVNGVHEEPDCNGTDHVDSRLGIVVVGMGIAGKVRVRDLNKPEYDDGRFRLVGYVSRRTIKIEGTTQLSEEEALTNPDVNVIIVCTEPGAHEDIVRKALNAGKHVLVEYPVATTAEATKQLYALATEKGLVLHEENIALLTPGFAEFKQKLLNAPSPVDKGEIKLIGNYNGWTEDFEKSGGPFCINVSMLETLYKLFGGDLKVTGGHLEVTPAGFTAVGKLSTSKGSKLSLTVRRTKERSKREKIFQFELADGTLLREKPDTPQPNPQVKKPGLFMRDFLYFLSEVNQKRDPSKDRERVIYCMELAEQIHKHMGLAN